MFDSCDIQLFFDSYTIDYFQTWQIWKAKIKSLLLTVKSTYYNHNFVWFWLQVNFMQKIVVYIHVWCGDSHLHEYKDLFFFQSFTKTEGLKNR